MEKGRFAPSPSGRMHLGNVFSFLLAWLDAKAAGGEMVLRMEDLDPQRTGEPYASQLVDDLKWLGLTWEEGWGVGGPHGPYDQRSRTALYEEAFHRLEEQGLVYPCWCSRHQRLAASAPHLGEKGDASCPCKAFSARRRGEMALTRAPAWKAAVEDRTVSFTDLHYGAQTFSLRERGDFILRRADGVYGYQLAVSVDDARMEVTRVVRGRDLLDSTPWQIWLMEKLGYQPPRYGHVPLLLAPDGKRLAKRDRDLDMGILREKYTPEAVIGKLAALAGLREKEMPASPGDLTKDFRWCKITTFDRGTGGNTQ